MKDRNTNHDDAGQELRLLSPEDGAELRTNTPALVWAGGAADAYEVWLNGVKVETVAGDRDRAWPFPLSFGAQRWFIRARRGGATVDSAERSFVVTDGPVGAVPRDATLLREGWRVQSAALATAAPDRISAVSFEPAGWHATSVPTTVLSVLVRNGCYPNPYVGLNNMRIPDMNDAFNAKHDLLPYSHLPGRNPWAAPYWFRTVFTYAPEPGALTSLCINELNYKADIWLNGMPVAGSAQVVGMDRRFAFDVSAHLQEGENCLALLVYPPDVPGEPAPPTLEVMAPRGRNMGADGAIARSYTKWDSIGWDWIPAVHDRDMGITEDVFLATRAPVRIEDVFVKAAFAGAAAESADLTVCVRVRNESGAPLQGTLKGTITPESGTPVARFEAPAAVGPAATVELRLSPESGVQALHIQRPALWWPVNYGAPHLYELTLALERDGEQADVCKTPFGIRKTETRIGEHERVFEINDRPVYVRAGNWVQDMMLSWTARRLEQEIRFAAQSNLNMLRVWGPTGVPPTAFFAAADRYGVMIWQDFLNDHSGTNGNAPELRPDPALYKTCTIDVIERLRNHPSLIFWCGGNEGPNPYEELIVGELLPQYDGSRFYLKRSDGDGLHGHGPYHTLRPDAYFTDEKIPGFNSEIGPSGVPPVESLRKFLPELGKTWKPDYFPLYADWGYHDAVSRPNPRDMRRYVFHDEIMRKDYGIPDPADPAALAGFGKVAELVNYDAYRAAIEAVNRDLWRGSSGFALWKYNSAWPSVVWQIFDWYQMPNAGFYGTQCACRPVHVQFNRDRRTVSVLNTTATELVDHTLTAAVYDTAMRVQAERKKRVHVQANHVLETSMRIAPCRAAPYFLVLGLADAAGRVVASNFYWLHAQNDFRALRELPEVALEVSAAARETADELVVDVTLTNPGEQLAFFTQLALRDSVTGEPVQPVYWDSNALSLLPGATCSTRVRADRADLLHAPVVHVSGWNVAECEVGV